MDWIQAFGRRHKTNRRKNPSHHRQTQAKELEGPKVIQGSNKPNETIYSKPGKLMRSIKTTPEKEQRMELARKRRKDLQRNKTSNEGEIKHFKRNLPLRIICDASKEGLGAICQQQNEGEWETTHYASRFLTEFEKKYSINEIELIAVVWAIEKFRNFVYGTEFEVVSDHKALTTILKNNRSNKTFSSR